MPSKAELFKAIRSDARRHELSIRALAELHGVHRRTVRAALASATPAPRKPRTAQAPKLEQLKPFIDAMLVADLGAPRKQKHTARRIWARLLDEHEAGDLSYSTVRDYVRRRRPEVATEAGRGVEQAFVLQTHLPGAEAEVDFGDVWVELAGELTRCFLFTLRMSYSGKAVHRVFASQGQEAFIEGHLAAFTTLGGVPSDKIRYDNLRSAVSRVLLGRSRTESDHWVRFRSHYGFDAFYCLPGIGGAHEKGGVEGEVGRFRRNHLVPVPVVASLAELNARIAVIDAREDARRVGSRARTIGADFAVEAPLLRALPAEGFEAGLWLTPRVDRYSRVTVRCAHYSVPVRFIGRQVRVRLSASEVVVFDGRTEVARHARSVRSGSQTLLLDHYLEVLTHKPGALAGATALVQARQDGTFTAAHEAFWAAARTAHGDTGGTRALVEVLLLHRHLAHQDVLAGLGAAAAMAGHRVKYTLAAKLVNELVEAADEKVLAKTIARYGRVDLLCIDELGYMELDRRGAELLFQVLTEREETNSVAIASNESFSGWTKTFTDPRLCAAIVDRLTFGANIIETGSHSYRLAHARAQRATT